jgi:hypothetical protein
MDLIVAIGEFFFGKNKEVEAMLIPYRKPYVPRVTETATEFFARTEAKKDEIP